MAVDSAVKRASATHFLVPGYALGVYPSGTVDRQASAWCYSGIAAEAAVTKRKGIPWIPVFWGQGVLNGY